MTMRILNTLLVHFLPFFRTEEVGICLHPMNEAQRCHLKLGQNGLTQPFACLPSHLPVDPISTFFSSNVVPGHRRASARTSLINSAHPGPARLARALELLADRGDHTCEPLNCSERAFPIKKIRLYLLRKLGFSYKGNFHDQSERSLARILYVGAHFLETRGGNPFHFVTLRSRAFGFEATLI